MRYSSDLTDEQWFVIEDLVGRPDPRGAKAVYERREVINAILYLNKTVGIQRCSQAFCLGFFLLLAT